MATVLEAGAVPSRAGLGVSAIPAVALVAIFIVLVWVGAAGVRGSDQYWYVADVESLIDGRGAHTNEIYPVSIRHEIAPLPRPFVHNILNTYLAAAPAVLFGAYGGWIILNVMSSFLTAFLIFCTVSRISDSRTAAFAAAACYLLLPATIWLTIQPLAEASIAPLVAAAVYLYVTADDRYWRWMSLLFAVILLVYSRESFVLLLPLVPLAYLVHSRPWRLAKLGSAAGLAAVGGALWLLGKWLFEPHISVSYAQVLGSAGPNASNMNAYFELGPTVPQISSLIAKAAHGLATQFVEINIGYFLFYLPFNLLTLPILVLLFARGRADTDRVIAAAVTAVALHLTTAAVVQNQFRYLLAATPPLLVAAGALATRVQGHRAMVALPTAITTAAVLILSIPGAALAWRSHVDARAERDAREELAKALNETVPIEDTVMVALDLSKGFEAQRLGYVLRPRRTLYVSDRYDAADYAALIRNAKAEWLISPRNSPVFARLPVLAIHESRISPSPLADWSLFSIERTSGAR